MCVLQNHAQRAPQIPFSDFIDVDPIVTDLSVGQIIKTVDQVGDGGLSRSRASHKGDLLSRRRIQPDVMEHDLVFIVAKVHVIEGDIASQQDIGGRSIRPERMCRSMSCSVSSPLPFR